MNARVIAAWFQSGKVQDDVEIIVASNAGAAYPDQGQRVAQEMETADASDGSGVDRSRLADGGITISKVTIEFL